jgi:hypothetical protein
LHLLFFGIWVMNFFGFLRRTPSAGLLLVQLLIILTVPLLGQSLAAQAVSWCLSALALVLVGVIIRRTPIVNVWGIVLVTIALVLSVGVVFLGWTSLAVLANLVEGVAYLYAAIGIIMYIMDDHKVTRDELYAAAAGFTLMAWGFAFFYSALQGVFPHSIISAVNVDAPRTWIELLFMSFSAQTNTGLGDVIAVHPLGRAVSAVQMFCGVMYVVLIVSRLVGMSIGQAQTHLKSK